MSRRGRFGKYGDYKRIERLRKSRVAPGVFRGKTSSKQGKLSSLHRDADQGQELEVRPARVSDAKFLRRLSRGVFRQYGPYQEILPRWFESDVARTFVALRGRRPVGFAMLGLPEQKWYVPRVCELLAIGVEPESQGMGIGRQLMTAVEKEAQAMGVETLVLHTAVRNLTGQKLFRKFGFSPMEVKEDFYPEGQDAVMMVKDLA